MNAAQRRRDCLVSLVRKLKSENVEDDIRWIQEQASIDYLSVDKDAVIDAYHGLIEKFDVMGRSDLSCELEQRFSILNSNYLDGRKNYVNVQLANLLLELSDSPLSKPLPRLIREERRIQDLTYEDILKDDPLIGDHWEDIASDDTLSEWSDDGDENTKKDSSRNHDHSVDSSLLDTTDTSMGMDLASFLPIRNEALAGETAAKFKRFNVDAYWLKAKYIRCTVSENDIVREVLLALLGQPTLIFKQSDSEQVAVRPGCSMIGLSHVTPQLLFDSHLPEFASLASSLVVLRNCQHKEWSDPFMADVIDGICTQVDTVINKQYKDLVNGNDVTLISLYAHLAPRLGKYTEASYILKTVLSSDSSVGVAQIIFLLDNFYQSVQNANLCGSPSLSFLISVFRQLLQHYYGVYVLPWLDSGLVNEPFFVTVRAEADGQSLWEKFSLDSTLIPQCFKSVAGFIFDIGRAGLLCTALGCTDSLIRWSKFDFDSMEDYIPSIDGLFVNWLEFQQLHCYFSHIHATTSQNLYDYLFFDYDITKLFQNHYGCYFMSNQNMLDFCFALFARLDESHLPISRHILLDLIPDNAPFTVTSLMAANDPLHVCFNISVNQDSASSVLFECFFTPTQLSMCQEIWRLLFSCARVSHYLTRTRSPTLKRFQQISFIQGLMLEFHMAIRAYISGFYAQLKSVSNVSGLIALHQKTVNRCYMACHLDNTDISSTISSLLTLCLNFNTGLEFDHLVSKYSQLTKQIDR